MSTSLAITNARLVDPASGHDGPGGVLIEDGVIAQMGSELDLDAADEVIDAKGRILAPALIDLRCAKEAAPDARRRNRRYAVCGRDERRLRHYRAGTQCPFAAGQGRWLCRHVAGLGQRSVRILSACGATQGLAGEQMAEIGLMVRGGAVYAGQGIDRSPIRA